MNAVLWAWHIGAVLYAWPLLRVWWHGGSVLDRPIKRKRWLVALSVGMPPVAAIWLLPLAVGYRDDVRKHERRRAAVRQRADDVAFWREQVAQGDVVSAAVGVELLAMWGASVAESSRRGGPARAGDIVPNILTGDPDHWVIGLERWRDQIRAGIGVPRALPGAHEYSHGCDCRNCVRARAADPRWRGSGPLIPSGRLRCRCGATSDVEMCTAPTISCGRL